MKLVLSQGEGLVVIAVAEAEQLARAFTELRKLPLDAIEMATVGELQPPGSKAAMRANNRARLSASAQPETASRGRTGTDQRTFTVVCKDAEQSLVVRCELAEAARAWVQAINTKLARNSALGERQGTFGTTVDHVPPNASRQLRTRNTQHIRL